MLQDRPGRGLADRDRRHHARSSRGFKTSASRAASATKYMFKLADRYDSKRKGYKSKITRLYVYRWFGEPRRHASTPAS